MVHEKEHKRKYYIWLTLKKIGTTQNLPVVRTKVDNRSTAQRIGHHNVGGEQNYNISEAQNSPSQNNIH